MQVVYNISQISNQVQHHDALQLMHKVPMLVWDMHAPYLAFQTIQMFWLAGWWNKQIYVLLDT